ncbi:hypothetical protein ACWC5I_31325 [Kitasatospora sp. NPDC001574]
MIEQEIAALAMSGATTIVAAMATDAWGSVRGFVLGLVRRRSPELGAEIEGRLDASAALITRGQNAERARELVLGQWQLELEEFLAAHPEAVVELRARLDSLRAELPAAQQQWVQNITARDHSTVNVVQHGTQHNHYMDSAPGRAGGGPVTEEREG